MRQAPLILVCLFLALDLTRALVAGEAERAPAGKFFGGIWQLGSRNQYFGSLFDQIVPENAGKWRSVQWGPGDNDWRQIDRIMALHEASGERMPVTLRWHLFLSGDKYSPPWVPKAADRRAATLGWLTAMIDHAGADRFAWIDVVSEPLHFAPSWRDDLGGAGESGFDWIIWAFAQARAKAPNAKLLIDEYDVLKNGEKGSASYERIIAALAERKLIDGIGEEALFLEKTSAAKLRAGLDRLARFKLPIYLTQYSCNIADDRRQLAVFSEQMRIFYEHPAVIGVNHWSFIEGRTWAQIPNGYLIRRDGSERPALTWLRGYLGRHLPPRPDGVAVLATSFDAAAVRWTGTGTLATGYRVLGRSGSGSGPWTTLTEVDATRAEAAVSGLGPDLRHEIRVVAFNDAGESVGSDAVPFDTSAPVIAAQPLDTVVVAGQELRLTAAAHGRGDLRHAWQFAASGSGAWQDLPASGATLTIPASPARAGDYRCRIADAHGQATTRSARVEVFAAAQIADERDGVVAIEAEQSAGSILHGDSVRWKRIDAADASGGAAMTSPLAMLAPWEEASELSFPVRITSAGTYRLAMRTRVPDDQADSVWWGIDKGEGNKLSFAKSATWTWHTSVEHVELAPGVHVLRIRRRRGGCPIDRIALLGPGVAAVKGDVAGP